MSISIHCPGCKKKLTGKDELAGKRVKCPGCGHAVVIPSAQPATPPKATKPATGKPLVPKKADGITAPAPKTPPPIKKANSVAAPSPPSLERRTRWPWYAGGGAAAMCLVAGLVFALLPGKDRNAVGDERPVLPDASAVVAGPTSRAAEVDTRDLPREGAGDPALSYDVVNADTAKHRGRRVTWSFTPLSAENERMLCALNRQEAMGSRHHGLYVVEFASVEEAGKLFHAAAFKPGCTITGTIAGTVDQFLVVRGGDGVAQKDIPKVTVPLLVYPAHKIGESVADKGNEEEKDRRGGITKEKLVGEWEGTLQDGAILALKFTDQLVVVSVLSPGIDRKKAREAVEWASGDVLRRLGPGTSSAENFEANDWAHKNLLKALAGEFAIGSTAYKIDDAKDEVKFWGNQDWNGDGIAKPAKDGALLVSGDLRVATVPETRIERVKSKPPTSPKASAAGGTATPLPTTKTTPEQNLERVVRTAEIERLLKEVGHELPESGVMMNLTDASTGKTRRVLSRQCTNHKAKATITYRNNPNDDSQFSLSSGTLTEDDPRSREALLSLATKISPTLGTASKEAEEECKRTQQVVRKTVGKLRVEVDKKRLVISSFPAAGKEDSRADRSADAGRSEQTPKQASMPKNSQAVPEKSNDSGADTDEIWPKRARAQYFEKPADLWSVFLTASEKLPKGGPRTPWTRLLPSATQKLIVGVVFYREPRSADVSVRVFARSGEVKLVETKPDFLMINSTYIRYVELVPQSGTFADDDYRAEVSINGKKVALLKWVIGKGNRDASKALTEREKRLLGKWRDAKNGAQLGGGRSWGDMKLSEDGSLIITVKDTKTTKPAFIWATYKLLDDKTIEVNLEGTSHDNMDIPRWGARDMAKALVEEKPYTMKVNYSVSAKELTFGGVNYDRMESRAAGTR